MSVVFALKLDFIELWQSERTAWSARGQLLALWQCLFNGTCVKCTLYIYSIEYFNGVLHFLAESYFIALFFWLI